MTLEEKLQQLFVHLTIGDEPGPIESLMARKPGGIHRFFGNQLDEAWRGTRRALELETLPLLVTGDLEAGGHGPYSMSRMPNQLATAAANDLELSDRLVRALAREGRALGFNWSFTPVVDVSKNIHSSIVGTRSYGSNIEAIIAQAVTHIRALQESGIAATAKHWPGEGFDQRDQHLVTTINPLSTSEWNDTFGRIYRAVFDAGVMTVMSAHIALPSWAEKLGVPEGVERYCPASQSAALNFGLMRDELGFNGLIVSDATEMAGLGSWTNRATAVPQVIASGCDMFLFSKDADADLELMRQGMRRGVLTEQRVEDAVTRILGLKAALGLHSKSRDERLPALDVVRAEVRSSDNQEVARAVSSKAVTLVKDTQKTLPLTVDQHRRIVVVSSGTREHPISGAPKQLDGVVEGLKGLGFHVRHFDPAQPPTPENTDLVLYVLAVESALTLSRIFLDWNLDHGGFPHSLDRFWREIPTVMVSFGHPYYLFDAPRVPTYVNAYSTIEAAQEAVVRKLTGAEEFAGVSPVDAFCGLPDAHY
ncbi:glycoside hydrolase family 3 protein [Rhizobium sp. Root1204]|uniref:glycoside hydrolase family 3 protein n=1 Tax=Rhizobium sp. Root1204 TaxID=1736428 RepID=UPI00138F1EFA|nr:glycoside hydrolase family 3 protein [Rhizobium sp. Root1204]